MLTCHKYHLQTYIIKTLEWSTQLLLIYVFPQPVYCWFVAVVIYRKLTMTELQKKHKEPGFNMDTKNIEQKLPFVLVTGLPACLPWKRKRFVNDRRFVIIFFIVHKPNTYLCLGYSPLGSAGLPLWSRWDRGKPSWSGSVSSQSAS